MLAFDWHFSEFDAAGEFLTSRQFDPENRVVSLLPLAVYRDGRIAAVLGEQRFFAGQERRDTVPLMLFHPEAAEADTLGTWMGLERALATVPGGRLLVPIGFARTAFHDSNGREVAIGSSDSLDVTVFSDRLDPVLRIVAPPDPRMPSDAAVAAWRKRMLDAIPIDNPDTRAAWSTAPVRRRYPGYDGLALDALGRVWVGEYPEPGAPSRRWIVFSREGGAIGQVHLPALAAVRLPGSTEILSIGHDRIALLIRNRFDDESVEVWRFTPSF